MLIAMINPIIIMAITIIEMIKFCISLKREGEEYLILVDLRVIQ